LDILLLTFTNQADKLLPTLQEEDDALSRLLSPRARQQHFFLHRESFTTTEELAGLITSYRDDLTLFHFSGHAGRDRLELGDGTGHGEGLAQLLGQCPRLKLVCLNGCSTQGLVQRMLDAGVPVVIATSAPVDDKRATFFSIRLYEALQQQFPLNEAFLAAKGALELAFSGTVPGIFRSAGFQAGMGDLPAWGLYFEEKNEHVLDWRLPMQAINPVEFANFTPNEYLIDTLFEALSAYNPDIQRLNKDVQRGMEVSIPKKRMAILNALPAPLAEPLRKLMVPVEKENEGFDKVSEARLQQIVQAYSTSLELLGFTMLAQLWEAYDAPTTVEIKPEQREVLAAFFRLNRKDREAFDFVPFVQLLWEIFDQNNIHYFIQELKDLRSLVNNDEKFVDAVRFLSGLRRQVLSNSLDRSAVGYQCQTGEESLAYLYSRLSYMARYRLATIQGIDVLKYRHKRQPKFKHATKMLHDLLGGFGISPVSLDHSLDTLSVLLLNEETWEYLNLSPFVVDENAFQERTEICKLIFFSHYLKQADTYCFKYVNKPDDPLLEISAQKYPLIKEQFEAFAKLLLHKPMSSV